MPEVNRVEYFNKTIIDLTKDTVTPEDLVSGVTAHASDGTVITGNLQNFDEQLF